ncbi:MAG: DALR anticodon-binding domain-containing protein, partial [Pseudomonadota bacterium]
ERLIVQQRDNGVSADVVKAIIPALATIDLVDITNRIAALQTFLASDDGVTLMAGYRRAANILKAEEKKDEVAIGGAIDTSALTAPEEVALHAAIVEARTGVADRVAAEDYAGAMGAIAGLRVPVDAFFDGVMVNVDDDAIRANRLRLLSELRGLTTEVADFSQISL